MKIIIAFAGETGSGKGAVADYLAIRYHAKKMKFSDMLRDVLDRYHLGYTRENLAMLSRVLREGFGQDIMSRVLRKDIENAQEDIVVLDGARRISDLDAIRDLSGFNLVYVESSLANRYQRIFARGEKLDERQKTFDEFKKDHELETERTILALRDHADYILGNDGTMDELKQRVDELVGQLRQE